VSALDEGRLVHATTWRFGYLLSQAGFSLLLFICLAQVLPADAFAAAALAQAVLVIASALADFGLSQATVTVLPIRLVEHPERAPELLGGAARVFLWAAGVTVLVTALATIAVPEPARLPTLLIGPAAAASVIVSGADGLLRSQGAFRRPVVLVTLSRAGSFLAVPVAVLSGSATLTSAGLSAGVVALTTPAAGVLLAAYRGASHRPAADLLRAAAPLGGAQFFILGAGRANTVILSMLISVRAAAAFEGAWRLFSLGQYVAGGLATGAAPFIGHAVGGSERGALRVMLLRLTTFVAIVGVIYGVALAAVGPMLSRLLLGDIGREVGDVLIPFALLSPLAFVGFLAMMTLASSDADRRFVMFGYGAGAVLGVPLVILLGEARGLLGAVTGCALGLAVAQTILIARFAYFLRRLSLQSADLAVAGVADAADTATPS
jgi:O-antigen/teichoic acid export membrane protein